jgi:hypothetical protein
MMLNECTKPEKKVSPEDYNDEYGPLRWRPGAEFDHGNYIGSELRRDPESRRTVAYTVEWILKGIAQGLRRWERDLPKDVNKLDYLNVLRQARATVDAETSSEVAKLRDAGASWSEIGTALGISKQAAQQKYGK